jgi:hypothetical protein
MVGDEDPVADFVAIHPFANLDNLSRHLMAEHPGGLLHPIPFHDIASADATGQYLDQQFPWSDLRGWHFLQPYIPVVIIHGHSHSCFFQSVLLQVLSDLKYTLPELI